MAMIIISKPFIVMTSCYSLSAFFAEFLRFPLIKFSCHTILLPIRQRVNKSETTNSHFIHKYKNICQYKKFVNKTTKSKFTGIVKAPSAWEGAQNLIVSCN